MKYRRIYDEILTEFKKECKEWKGDSNEYKIIVLGLEEPEKGPKWYRDEFERRYGLNLTVGYVKKLLDILNLNHPEKRNDMNKKINIVADEFKQALNGNKKGIEEIQAFTRKTFDKSKDGRVKLYFKCLVTYLICIDEDLKDDNYESVIVRLRNPKCNVLIKKIISKIAKAEGINKKINAVDELKKTQEFIDSGIGSNVNEDVDKESLLFEISNYQNTIEVLQNILDEVRESVDETVKEADKNAIVDFFIKLNSDKYGNILDNFITVEKNLKEIRSQKIKMPNQVIALPMIFKQLIKFIKDIGIEPIDELGRCFKATFEDIEKVNYNGLPFMEDDEVKEVEVVKCGWKYKNNIITKPTLKEKINEF